MGCGASSVNLENDEKKKDKRSRKSSSSSSSSSDNSSDEESPNGEPIDMITKTLLKEYLDREINMLKLELTQPEVIYYFDKYYSYSQLNLLIHGQWS